MHSDTSYQVLIVDDEPLFRLALRTLLTESGLPLTIIGEAFDGEEALQFIQSKRPAPDIIFVDMKMPRVNGIQFLCKLKEQTFPKEINAVTVALSAYQEYSFVREAFLHGALDYIVKVDMDEQHIVPVVEKAIAEVQKRRSGQMVVTKAVTNEKEVWLRRLLDKDETIAIDHLVGKFGLRLPELNRVLCFILLDQWTDLDPDNDDFDDIGTETVRFVLEQALQSKVYQVQIIRRNVGEYALLMGQAEARSLLHFRNQLYELFTIVQRRLVQYANVTATVGVSSIGTAKPWRKLYTEAMESASLRFFHGCGKVFYHESSQAWEYKRSKSKRTEDEFLADMGAVLRALNNTDASVWKSCFADLSNRGVPFEGERETREHFNNFIWKLGIFLHSREGRWELLEEPFQKPFVLIQSCLTLDQIWNRLMQLTEAVHNKVFETVETANSLLQQAISYIDRHYRDGITLTLVSQWVKVSESHLSKLFVKETGEKFIDYLTRIRIQKAIELMKTDMKLYEIAEYVGYPNAEHFSRVFKKITGHSPAQYRDADEEQKIFYQMMMLESEHIGRGLKNMIGLSRL